MAAWIKPEKVGTQYLVKKAIQSGGDGYEISLSANGRAFGRLNQTTNGNAFRVDAVTSYPPDGNTWQHLALTYDGTKAILYADGQVVASRDQTGPVADIGAPFRLGARSEAPGDLTGVIDGRLDSWALWPAALSPAQIEARRQRGLAEPDPVPDPAWPCSVSGAGAGGAPMPVPAPPPAAWK